MRESKILRELEYSRRVSSDGLGGVMLGIGGTQEDGKSGLYPNSLFAWGTGLLAMGAAS